MDITFSCDKCGQSIVIDESGAGITVDCPNCGKPVYVPSGVSPSVQSGPIRIETPSARPRPTAAPIPPVPSRPVGLTYGSTSNIQHRTPNVEQGVHPSIIASLRCLIIGVGLALIGFAATTEHYDVGMAFLGMAGLFLAVAPWCAVYGMCVGEVNRGLLLLGVMSLGIGFFIWVPSRGIPSPAEMQRQIEQQMRQFMH